MSAPTPSGAEIIRQWLRTSPFVGYLSIDLVALEPGKATLRLPYDNTVTTIGTVIHGGAIATLLDSAGAAAAWSDAEVPANVRGTTVSLSVSYLAAADNDRKPAADIEIDREVAHRPSPLQPPVEVHTSGARPGNSRLRGVE